MGRAKKTVHKRYKIKGTAKTVEIEDVRFTGADGRLHGLGTRVTFDDGWKTTFMARARSKNEKEACAEQALWMKNKGDKSE
jgi:hypothetical protein